MLRRARSKAGGQALLELADMRALPSFGQFDLVWAIDDAVNYLLTAGELTKALRGMAHNLAPSGRVLFDTNCLAMYRTFYAETQVIERGQLRLIWRGLGNGETKPGSEAAARFEVASLDGADRKEPLAATHRQRHFPAAEVVTAMEAAGLSCLAVLGQGLDGHAEQPLNEERHTKAIFIGKKRNRR